MLVLELFLDPAALGLRLSLRGCYLTQEMESDVGSEQRMRQKFLLSQFKTIEVGALGTGIGPLKGQ